VDNLGFRVDKLVRNYTTSGDGGIMSGAVGMTRMVTPTAGP